MVINLHIPRRTWLELHEAEFDVPCSCDVIVEMENGDIFTATFVTLPYLRRQMELSFTVSSQIPYTPPVRYAALEVPHVLVEELNRDVIDDTIDNLLAMDMFDNIFTLVTERNEDPSSSQEPSNGRRATQEMAQVVLSDVLVVESGD